MKRFRAQTWTGMIVGSLLTLVVAAIGLTDAIQAQDERVAEQRSEHVATVDADGDAGEAVDDPQKTAQVPPPVETLKPKIFFAQHVILWNGAEILTSHQLQERLKNLRATQPVKPFVYHSLGFAWKDRQGAASEADADERANKTMRESLELIGSDQWSLLSFLSRRGSGVVDRIRSDDDLKLDSAKSLKGRVVLSLEAEIASGSTDFVLASKVGTPAEGAQVVILPLGEPADVHLRNGKLREPQDETWYATNADGTFEADPASLPFDPVLLYGDGKYLTLILHESGYRIINGQLAASDATYELLPWHNVTIDTRNLKEHERVEFWLTPEGAHEKFPGLSIGTFSHSDEPFTVKMPRAKGRAAYLSVVDGEWNDTKFRHPIEITADGPKEVTLPAVP